MPNNGEADIITQIHEKYYSPIKNHAVKGNRHEKSSVS